MKCTIKQQCRQKLSACTALVMFVLLSTANIAQAQKEFVQRTLLDKPVTAGSLKVFPLLDEPNSYYYLPNKVRLGIDDQGRPQISFIRFKENVRSGATDKEITQSNGGGYVHLLVGMSVTPEELQTAGQQLKNINPQGKIVGPVIYRGGTMTLITKSMLNEGQKKVLGIGPAPVIEGDKVAVSFLLDKDDATLLWETFKTPAPDISFNLNMTLAGYQSPVEFKIEMNWDKIYSHDIFNAGLATPVMQAEIGIAVQQLKESGGIKVTQIGEDANVQKLQDVLVNKMIDMCFVPFGREGSPNWADLAQPLNGGKSYLDRATEQLNTNRRETREENTRIRTENREERRYTDEENRRLRAEARTGDTARSGSSTAGTAIPVGTLPSRPIASSFGNRPPSPSDQPVNIPQQTTATQRQEESMPSINAVVSYQKKTIKHTGTYTAEAKTYFTTSLSEVFGGNIGKINCKDCLREVDMTDPLYTQRELVCFLDGEISQDFNKFINYVSVSMRKKHAGGDITTDEVRVDRKNFTSEGNSFKLLYGWKQGDNNRRNWLNYDYKMVWNFFGGGTIEGDWVTTDVPVIPLKSPVVRRTANIQGDPEVLKQKNIRSIAVKIYYKIGNTEEQFKGASLNVAKGPVSVPVDFILPKGQAEYEYEVEWLGADNKITRSGRLKTSQDDIYVDVIPANTL